MHANYSRVFAATSLWTAFFLGVVAAACTLGRIDPSATDYHSLYVAPWCNAYCAMVGLFTCCLCAFLAAVFLLGETSDLQLQAFFRRRVLGSALGAVGCGGLVLLLAQPHAQARAAQFFTNHGSQLAFASASLLWLPLYAAVRGRPAIVASRLLAAAQVGLVLVGWFAVQFPVVIAQAAGPDQQLTVFNTAAPPATQRAMLLALGVGCWLIFPSLAYLLKVFKWDTLPKAPPPGAAA